MFTFLCKTTALRLSRNPDDHQALSRKSQNKVNFIFNESPYYFLFFPDPAIKGGMTQVKNKFRDDKQEMML